ncbi:MAG TPA: capsule assembly Wzi family protein [Deltaproteobacteria bacterium]|nr:capsule assembly Wzi family protein [Deltaproteobacteria bacterium]
MTVNDPSYTALPAFLAALIALAAVLSPQPCSAGASTNIPLSSPVYRDLERLEVRGLVKSAMLSTRPFSRSEGARLVREALRAYDGLPPSARGGVVSAVLARLEREFAEELEGDHASSYLKPVDRLYAAYSYSRRDPLYEERNSYGDELGRGSNVRTGLAMRGRLLGAVSYYMNPEYRAGEDLSRGKLVLGYATLALGPFEIEAGRDAMWWGASRQGALLLSNNAEPFDMVRVSTTHPVLLPSFFRHLGPIKPTWFLTELGKDRPVARPRLMGMRLDAKPLPWLQVGLSRVIMFGGEGRAALSASDWLKILYASDSAEHSNSPINGNQLASLDLALVFAGDSPYLPFHGVKLYTEWGAEDSSGKTKTPTGRANICGVFVDGPFRVDRLDLRVEWANTARNARYGPAWYAHGVYYPGYRYRNRVIGHYMGGDSRDLFARIQYSFDTVTVGVEADRKESRLHGGPLGKTRSVGADLVYYLDGYGRFEIGWSLTDDDDPLTSVEGAEHFYRAALSLEF